MKDRLVTNDRFVCVVASKWHHIEKQQQQQQHEEESTEVNPAKAGNHTHPRVHPLCSYSERFILLPFEHMFSSQSPGAAVAQEVRAVVWKQEGCWFDPQDA